MPEARLQRTREVYDWAYDRDLERLHNLIEFARRVTGPLADESDTVTDWQTGHTVQIRIPRRFEVRR